MSKNKSDLQATMDSYSSEMTSVIKIKPQQFEIPQIATMIA